MVAFAAGVSVLCVVLIGLVPAIRASRADLSSLIKQGAGTGAHRRNRRSYGWMLIVQIGLTLPVVSAAVLLARAGWQMHQPLYEATQRFGFDPDSLIVAHVSIPARRKSGFTSHRRSDRLLGDANHVRDVANAAALVCTRRSRTAGSPSPTAPGECRVPRAHELLSARDPLVLPHDGTAD